VFWGVDPVQTHPRHFERYSVDPAGMFVPRGRADRTVIVVDAQETDSARLADIFIPVTPGQDFEVLWALRCLVRGIPIKNDSLSGISLDALASLADRLTSCRCGIFFFGLGLARTDLGHRNVEALLLLVRDLNAHTRFHARRMRIPGDVTGADCVLCWHTGYPFSVNLSRGYPRYNPGEFSANDLLERGEIDACLFVGSEGVTEMSSEAKAHLASIPTITLDHPTVPSAISPTIRFTTAVHGVHLPGTAYRMDEVPIPLRPLLPASYQSDAKILGAIRDSCKQDYDRQPAYH
jgi:formylmethanofuran dehydrogenase subunit B